MGADCGMAACAAYAFPALRRWRAELAAAAAQPPPRTICAKLCGTRHGLSAEGHHAGVCRDSERGCVDFDRFVLAEDLASLIVSGASMAELPLMCNGTVEDFLLAAEAAAGTAVPEQGSPGGRRAWGGAPGVRLWDAAPGGTLGLGAGRITAAGTAVAGPEALPDRGRARNWGQQLAGAPPQAPVAIALQERRKSTGGATRAASPVAAAYQVGAARSGAAASVPVRAAAVASLQEPLEDWAAVPTSDPRAPVAEESGGLASHLAEIADDELAGWTFLGKATPSQALGADHEAAPCGRADF